MSIAAIMIPALVFCVFMIVLVVVHELSNQRRKKSGRAPKKHRDITDYDTFTVYSIGRK